MIIGFMELVLGILGLLQLWTSSNNPFIIQVIEKVWIALSFVAGVSLIVGVKKQKPTFLYVWIRFKFVLVVILVFLTISVALLFRFYVRNEIDTSNFPFVLCEVFLTFLFVYNIYIMVVVKTFKKQMDLRNYEVNEPITSSIA